MDAAKPTIDPASLPARLEQLPGIAALRELLAGEPAWLVGGSVRDLLLGRGEHTLDLDVAVEGDAIALAHRLGTPVAVHERFLTASVVLKGGVRVDLARTRSESYPRPGALPEVRPARLRDDLSRRDFTINAMAYPLAGGELLDPHGGLDDLRSGRLRVLHDASFRDDPTRALRAARYAARLGFEPEPRTLELLRAADLGTVSADRSEAELRLLAAEERAAEGFELIAGWGILRLRPDGPERVRHVLAALARPGWGDLDHRADAVLAAALGDPEREERAERLAAARPQRPSQAVALARGRDAVELLLARALGAEWLDDYVREWRHVRLEISGRDLLAAGVPQGPAIGAGLAAALEAKLDRGVRGRELELAEALAVAAS